MNAFTLHLPILQKKEDIYLQKTSSHPWQNGNYLKITTHTDIDHLPIYTIMWLVHAPFRSFNYDMKQHNKKQQQQQH